MTNYKKYLNKQTGEIVEIKRYDKPIISSVTMEKGVESIDCAVFTKDFQVFLGNFENIKDKYESERLYPLGFQFCLKRGKQNVKEMKIVDYVIAHNSGGKVISFHYVCEYDFCGQKMTSNEVQTTIDIATNNGWKNINHKNNFYL